MVSETGGFGVVDLFEDGVLEGWEVNTAHQLTEEDGILKISVRKSLFEGFSFTFPAMDITANPVVSVKVKTDRHVNLDIFVIEDLSASPARYDNNGIRREIIPHDDFVEYTFNFVGITKASLTQIKGLLFNFNGGSRFPNGSGRANIYFDDLKVGNKAILRPSLVQVPNQDFAINADEQSIRFWGLDNGFKGRTGLGITASSNNTTLIPHPVVEYTDGEASGLLHLSPVLGQSR
ncbi:MAG: hypothetical protein HC842_01145 [Cytophagales bacterium]|nr:hypothetical protein [Cytophagales bacterium]